MTFLRRHFGANAGSRARRRSPWVRFSGLEYRCRFLSVDIRREGDRRRPFGSGGQGQRERDGEV